MHTYTYTYTISKALQFESIYKIYIFLFSLQKGDEPCMCISHSYEAIRN